MPDDTTHLLAQPGMRGVIALPLTAVVGYAFAGCYVARLGGLHPLGKVATHAIMVCVVAAVFWAWAACMRNRQSTCDLAERKICFRL